MSRTSNDQYFNGRLINGYDYTNQAWVVSGVYVRCGHPEAMRCGCYGRKHEGESVGRGEEMKQPSHESLVRMSKWDGVCKATDGCLVDHDGHCEHGYMSWLLKLGYI